MVVHLLSGTPRWRRATLVALFAVASCPAQKPATAGTRFAVIVHPDNPVDDVSLKTLFRIFRGQKRRWDHGRRILLLLPKAGTPEKRFLLARVYRMHGARLKRHWIRMLYRNKLSRMPVVLPSAEAAAKLVGRRRGAIAIVAAAVARAAAGVKILEVQGHSVDASSYPLTMPPRFPPEKTPPVHPRPAEPERSGRRPRPVRPAGEAEVRGVRDGDTFS